MLKYANYSVTLREVPDEISLCINISGCKLRCKGCHSKYLWLDTGTELNEKELKNLIKKNKGISCVCLMGGDHESQAIYRLGKIIKDNGLKAAWYSGESVLDYEMTEVFDFIKLGRYDAKLGGLESPTTNQHLYRFNREENTVSVYSFKDKVWKNEEAED